MTIMLERILQNKWYFLVSLEITAWTVTFLMLYARYRLHSSLLFHIFSVLFVLTGVLPQVSLGILNFMTKQEIDLFTLVIVLLLIYGFTIGRSQVRRLDDWARHKF